MRAGLALCGAVAAGLLALGAAPEADAHHSMAMFDGTKQVSVTGVVKAFQWSNPHCYIQVMAKDASGKQVEWSMEMGAPMYLYARGWRPSTLKAGTPVTVKVSPLRNGQPGGVVLEVLDGEGKPVGRVS